MKQQHAHTLLGIPTVIWILQLLYVGLALALFAALSLKLQTHRLPFQIGYVLCVVLVNIVWRVAVKKTKPAWF